MGGCLTLLQSWAWYRLPFLAPIVDRLPTYPFASRWGQRNLNYRGIPRGDLTGYRSRLDRMDVNDTDRVRLQFRLLKDLPQPPDNLDALHRVDKWGNLDTNWATRHAEWIDYWSHRRDQVQQGRISFHEASQRHRIDDMMPSHHSFSTDHNDFMNNLLSTPDSTNQLFNDIGYNFNQDGAGPSSFMVDTNIFPTGQTDTVPDPTAAELRRTRRTRQPRRCGTGGHLGNH
ncbi:hypothetical protein Lal_00026601 [Lupinus albus]|nr:hypothetical protein Lal_00026601 [Lupinus albus]